MATYYLFVNDNICDLFEWMNSPKQTLGSSRRLSMLKKELLGKEQWRFSYERACLWRRIIARKYGEMARGWCSTMVGLIVASRR